MEFEPTSEGAKALRAVVIGGALSLPLWALLIWLIL